MKGRILFVDDEPNMLDGLRRLLKGQSEWNLEFASSADKALKTIADTQPDVIVTDISMPEKSGLDLLSELKRSPTTEDIEVVVLTGLREHDLKRRALDLGAADLLHKPVDRDELIARLNSALRVRCYKETLRSQNEAMKRQLVRSQKMEVIGVLSAGLVHDLNNILSLILAHSELVGLRLTGESPLRKSIDAIESACNQAAKIVEQVLRFTRETRGPRQCLELNKIIDDCLALLMPAVPHGVSVIRDGDREGHCVCADPSQLHQVFMNLFLNACQAMGEKGELRIEIRRADIDPESIPFKTALSPGLYERISVTDTGGGMDRETIGHMFDPMVTTKERGTGLGLSVVKWIVEDHAGFVRVEVDSGKGTTFVVYLPPALEDSI